MAPKDNKEQRARPSQAGKDTTKEEHQNSQYNKPRKEEAEKSTAGDSRQDNLKCSNCNQLCKSPSSLAMHTTWCTNDHRCADCSYPECDVPYATDRDLFDHWVKCHQPQKCRFCSARLPPNHIEWHEHFEHNEEFAKQEHERRHRWDKDSDEQDPRQKPCKERDEKRQRRKERDERKRQDKDDENQYWRWGTNGNRSNQAESLVAMPDHYKILGISRDASATEIEQAAKAIRIQTHPDWLKRSPYLTAEQMAQIDEVAKNVGWAADTLCDAIAKAEYDRQWKALHG